MKTYFFFSLFTAFPQIHSPFSCFQHFIPPIININTAMAHNYVYNKQVGVHSLTFSLLGLKALFWMPFLSASHLVGETSISMSRKLKTHTSFQSRLILLMGPFKSCSIRLCFCKCLACNAIQILPNTETGSLVSITIVV